jgi:hypothetical protein
MKSQMEQDLDELHKIVKKMDLLLNDRQPGLSTWLTFLADDMKDLKKWVNRVMPNKET